MMRFPVRVRAAALMLVCAAAFAACGGGAPAAGPSGGGGPRIRMSSTADLNDKRIGVVLGSVHDTLATKNYPGATVLQYESSHDLTLGVLAGKVDAALSDAEPLAERMRTNPDLAVLGEPLIAYPIAAGFRKGDTALRDAFNVFLAEIRTNGVHAGMVERWFHAHDTPMPDLTVPNPRGEIVVGVSGGGLPFAAVRDGELVGFDIELVRRFAASVGRTVKFSQMPFGSLIASVAAGKVEMIVASIFITDERSQRIDFSDAYHESGVLVYGLKANIASAGGAGTGQGTARLTSLDDLADKRIGVQLGTVYDIYAIRTFPKATVLQYPTYQEVTLAVSAGKVDAGLSDLDTLAEVMLVNPELVPFGKPIMSSPVAAGFAKSSAELRTSFNTFLAGIRQDGVWADMVDRWMTKRSRTMPDLPAGATTGTLVVGISSGGFPFAAVQDNALAGFDVELARRFGAHLGREVRFADQEFSGLIAALASGKIDTIMSGMFATEERAKQIDFSDPYVEQDSVAFTLKANAVAPGSQAAATAARVSMTDRLASSFRSNILHEQRYLLIWEGLKTTALISVLATLFGTALGALVCYMRMSPLAFLRVPARMYISVLRGIPVLVLLMLIFYVVFASVNINPVFVAVVAFGMNFAAYVSEMFRSGIEGVDKGQSEAGIAMGFTRTQTFGFIVLPQMVQRILPIYKGEFISLVKMTSIVGYIAVQDLTKASDIIRSRTFDAFFPLIMVAVLYFLMAWVLMQALDHLERVTDPKYRRRKAVAR
jgi:polar amino acid transport system substrate-binding protein